MRRHLQILTFLAAFAAPCGMAQAQTLNAAKIDNINKATESFLALAKDSHTTGKPPRYSDAAVKPLLDTVFNTKEIEGGKPLPWSSVQLLQDWTSATLKVGLVYYLAGTGSNDVVAVSKDPQKILKANSNTVAFAPEFGLYYDAQIRIYSAMVDAAAAQLAAATPEQIKEPAMRTTLNNVSDGVARAMIGLLGTFVLEGLPEDWLLSRVVVLLGITPKAAKFMAPNDRKQVRNAAVEAAEGIKNPDAKSGVNTIARAFERL